MRVMQFFTPRGTFGVILFLMAPMVEGLVWYIFLRTGNLSPMLWMVLVVAVFASLISLPMMLIGREFDVRITHIPKDAIR